MAQSITLQSVGVVRSPFSEDAPERDWADVEAEIHINADLLGGLKGIENHSHLVVVFFLHKFTFDHTRDLQQAVPNRDEMVGVFALRTNRRPNAIGTTTVRVIGVEERVIRVRGLDALDGSPVLDIKPYAPPERLIPPNLTIPDVSSGI